jgi:CheY-like chemotaxis protein
MFQRYFSTALLSLSLIAFITGSTLQSEETAAPEMVPSIENTAAPQSTTATATAYEASPVEEAMPEAAPAPEPAPVAEPESQPAVPAPSAEVIEAAEAASVEATDAPEETASAAIEPAVVVTTAENPPANLKKRVIITGTFQTEASANKERADLQVALESDPEYMALQTRHGFECISRASGNYHIVIIEPIYGSDVVSELLTVVRKVIPDAYEYVKPKPKPKVVAEPAAPVETEVVVVSAPEPVKPVPVAEKPAPAPVEAAPVEVAPAPVKTTPPAPKPAPTVVDEEIQESTTPVISEMMMYGGIAVAVLLLVIVVMRKGKSKEPEEKKEEEKPLETAAVDAAEAVVEPEPAPEVQEETAVVEASQPEEISTVDEVPAPEPIVEETTVPELQEVEETPVAQEPEATPEAEPAIEEPAPVAGVTPVETEPTSSGRKKREPKPGRGKITKEDLAEFSGNRILVAEDNMINQKVITSLMADSGMGIIVANDGQEALNVLALDSNFNMILMDAHMPVKDGFEATREIRANSAYDHIPVVALSGDIAADDLRKMAEAGMEEQLAKPIHLEDLYDVMYCYFDIQEASDDDEDDVELLPDTDELHAEEGLDSTGGDEDLYKEILGEFKTMYGKSDQTLHEYIVQDNTQGAQALLLDVQGLAGSIRADLLADTAQKLREAMINGDEAQYNPLYEEYCAHLQKLLGDIDNL